MLPRVPLSELAAIARHQPLPPDRIDELATWRDEVAATRTKRGLRGNRDPRDLAQAGWGIIFAADDPRAEAIQVALADLLALREGQATREKEHYFRVFQGKDGFRQGETNRTFLRRHGVGPGAADPDYMPYYLLLVGTPEQIPYSFQYQLDIEYAVGRISFDTLVQYRHYARNVVAAEEPARRNNRAVFFGPSHRRDPATALSAENLVRPLAGVLRSRTPRWKVETVVRSKATKARLKRLLGGDDTPGLLLTAGHGVMFHSGDPRQRANQGALVCQDWGGPGSPVQAETYLSAADVPESAAPRGLVLFNFACFSAGTPEIDDFALACGASALAPKPFLARLPQRLLGRRNGALAVIGHVERAWECSIEWPGVGRWIQPFEDACEQLLTGYPVGAAMEAFGKRYAELACDLGAQLQEEWRGGTPDPELLAGLWTWCNDARNYAVIGDPAVRLPVPPPSGAH